MMYKTYKLAIGGTLCATMVFAGAPMVFANTTGAQPPTTQTSPTQTPPTPSIQDLTSLGTISTTVTGQADALFSKIEQTVQQYPITDPNQWTGFCRQGGRDITVQFAAPVNVQNISINMEQLVSNGIFFPNDVQFQGYASGQWYTLSQDTSAGNTQSNTSGTLQISTPNPTHTFQFSDTTGVEVTAVRVSFPVDVWVFANGLSVTGSTTSVGVTPSVPTYSLVTQQQQFSSHPMTPAQADGIKNMLLVYTGSHGSIGTWSSSDFKPMLNYINPAGQTGAPLFDTMLFVPYGGSPDTKTRWNSYLSNLFAPNQQLSALNQAVAASDAAQSQWGHKEKVVLSIPYFPPESNNFGAVGSQHINFAGSANGPNSLNARTIATYWYINSLLLDWQMANYQNLQLVGLYWDHEQFNLGAPNEQQFFQIVEGASHQHGLPLLWIPSYGAVGTHEWKSLGLNAAWLQSNYIEQGANAHVSRITEAVTTANDFGMGMEVELTSLDSATLPLYQTLLRTLSADGFGGSNVSHAYYDGSKLLLQASQSTNPTLRSVYDETANFILNGTASTQPAP